ncbi:TetR/AcrR family transcriptional regulator [Thalassotalea euphylliae]|uniref:TetR family transcriptional regulator n=1 Tax=Thalassotalea euphylliae TaxID=1655234 RepID=A0A3E0UDM5_9GAMM|nr:TetR/AcrR family transcriptional regulator [Thalassotalea euphylliae]REL34996.1 TetR family transcriptional regulator [Thalassotalea euphylliae]
MTDTLIKPRRGRPPKVARDNQDTKAALIRSGLEQLTENGFASSGIDQILRKVGVPKGSFYHYFASKEAFGQAVIDSYATYFARKLDLYLLDETHPPLTRIANFVDDAKQGMQRYQFKRGCLVGNLGQEVDLLPLSYRQQLIDIFSQWQQKLEACLSAAQACGELATKHNCAQLAEDFWIGWEGAVSRAKLVQNAKPLDNYLAFFIARISQSE